MFRIFSLYLALFFSFSTSFVAQAEQEKGEQGRKMTPEEMTSALLHIQVYVLAHSPHVNAETFDLLAEVSDPAINGVVVAEVVKVIMLKVIGKNSEGEQVDESAFEKHMKSFAKAIGVEFEELQTITQQGTTNRDVLEKVWQQEQITADEFVAINSKIRKALISDERMLVLNEIPTKIYRHFAMLTVAGKGILAEQLAKKGDDEQASKPLGTDRLFEDIKNNYSALVEFGLEEGILTAGKYAAPEALTSKLATSVDTFVSNIQGSSRHAGTRFFEEKLAR